MSRHIWQLRKMRFSEKFRVNWLYVWLHGFDLENKLRWAIWSLQAHFSLSLSHSLSHQFRTETVYRVKWQDSTTTQRINSCWIVTKFQFSFPCFLFSANNKILLSFVSGKILHRTKCNFPFIWGKWMCVVVFYIDNIWTPESFVNVIPKIFKFNTLQYA